MDANRGCLRSAGRTFSEAELEVVTEVVGNGGSHSRTQLMIRVCQRLQWYRPTGALKVRECRDLLATMERAGWFELPAKRGGRPLGSRTEVPVTPAGEPGQPLLGTVGQFGSVRLAPVTTGGDHRWWRELMGRYHYLGYRMPFGAQLRYLAFVSEPTRTVVAALQVSSPAWRLAARDRWIGWDEPTRARNLQRVVNNSRFLVLPWVRVQNLASRLLALLAKRLAVDWQGPLRHRAAAAGDAGGWQSFCRHLLPGGELDRARRHDRSRAHGPRPCPAWAGTEAGAGVSSGGRRSAPAGAGLSDGRCAGVGDRDTGGPVRRRAGEVRATAAGGRQ